MNFKEALKYLRQGLPIKRKYWEGYWIKEEEKVIIHLKEGDNLDLQDTNDIIFTLSNIAEDDWEIATETNCPRLVKDNDDRRGL
jgi:hypothetical protein